MTGSASSPATGAVLVVDDDRLNRIVLTRSLEAEGHMVATAENGRVALGLLDADALPDVILLDILMPELDGFAVLEHIKGDPRLRDIPVIMISAVDQLESVVRCIEAGAEDYLPKPFDPTLLRARINAGLTKRRLVQVERDRVRRLRPVPARDGRRRGHAPHERGATPRRRPARRHRPLQRSPRIHDVCRGARAPGFRASSSAEEPTRSLLRPAGEGSSIVSPDTRGGKAETSRVEHRRGWRRQ